MARIHVLSTVKNQVLGVINLSVPLILAFYVYPVLLTDAVLSLLCAVLVGIYVVYLNYKVARNQSAVLGYAPSGDYVEYFGALIDQCGLDRQRVVIRYAYTDEAIALTNDTTISIDPLIWHIDDPQSLAARQVLEQHVLSGVPEIKKRRIGLVHDAFCSLTQAFIFKHELGHVARHYFWRKLSLLWCISVVASYAGIVVWRQVPFAGIIACSAGMLVAGILDFVLSYASNVLFKYYEERQADVFAITHSTVEEVEAAAVFFEKHEQILAMNPDASGVHVPSIIATGHPNGFRRAQFLRACKRIVKAA